MFGITVLAYGVEKCSVQMILNCFFLIRDKLELFQDLHQVGQLSSVGMREKAGHLPQRLQDYIPIVILVCSGLLGCKRGSRVRIYSKGERG